MRVIYLYAALCAACAEREPEAITVCAAASLREVAKDVGDAWARESGARVDYRFDSSDTLARRIREGAPADIYLTADPRWLGELEVLESFPWVGNRLVLVRRRGAAVTDLAALTSLALGSQGTPAGRYSLAALRALDVAPPRRTVYGASVRDVLARVAEGAAEAGIVYATDVALDPRVEVAFELPARAQPDFAYHVALLAERGRALYDAFRAPAALEAAKRRGFREP